MATSTQSKTPEKPATPKLPAPKIPHVYEERGTGGAAIIRRQPRTR